MGSELYNHESCGDNAVLDCSQPLEDLQPILRGEVEIAETMIDVLTEILNRIWRREEWLTPMDSVAEYYTP